MARYASYARYRWGTNLAEHPEFFMAQDVERWENGQYVQTMYCMTNSGHPEINKGYVLESVHIDKPHERAYHHFPELPEQLTGGILFTFLDQQINFVKKKGGGRNVIGRLNIEKKPTPAEFCAREIAAAKESESGETSYGSEEEEEEAE